MSGTLASRQDEDVSFLERARKWKFVPMDQVEDRYDITLEPASPWEA